MNIADRRYSVDRFNALCKEFADRELEIMDWKNKEYARQEDKLQNFREIALFEGRPMSHIALSYLLKHVQAVKKQVHEGRFAWAWETGGGEELKQRIADIRNYMLLLAACLDGEVEE